MRPEFSMRAQFTHNCRNCTFLGTFAGLDLYHCLQGIEIPTVIARYGNEGHEYKSGLPGADGDFELSEAKKRAAYLGLKLDR